MKRKEIISLVILLLVLGFGAWNYFNSSFTETRSKHLMDTVVRITATSKSKNVASKIDSVFAYIHKLEKKLNDYDPDSWVYQINNSDKQEHPMDADAFALLSIADSLYHMTGGKFDISIKPVYDLWGFGSRAVDPLDSLAAAPPDSLKLQELLAFVGFERIKYDKTKIIKPVGMQISFGAIAKGYILDKAREYMQSLNITSGYIDCRSSMTFFGDTMPQMVYIQHPRLSGDDFIASFRIKQSSVGTSGDYQQFFEHEGQRYHHILDPATGYPIPNVYSTTVIHPSAAWADGLATALFVMPPEAAIESIKNIPACNAVIYHDQGGTTVSIKSMGMKDMGLTEKI